MKKIFWIVILCIFLIDIDVSASTKTYTRTKDNLLVPENVEVNEDNINSILNTKAVDSKEKIYDFAQILTKKEEEALYKNMKEYIKESDVDLVFLTEKNVGDMYPTDYMKNFYDYNMFKKNGIIFLVLMDVKEVKIFMITTGNITDFYTEERIEDILRYVYDSFDTKKYYEGFDTYIKIVHGFYKMELKEGGTLKIDDGGNVVKTFPWIDIVILSITVTFIIVFISFYLFDNKTAKVLEVKNNDVVEINKESEEFLGDDVIKTEKKPKN